MKLLSVASAALMTALAHAQNMAMNVSVSFDNTYDNASGSTDITSCSNGVNGLFSHGFPTFGSVPGFPNIGGAGVIQTFDSDFCGTCWQLTFNNTTINVVVLDHAGQGTFNIAQKALDELTNDNAVFLGRVNAVAQMVGPMQDCEVGSRSSNGQSKGDQ